MLALPGPAILAASVESAICDRAARIASSDTGVPMDVLMAITRSETGRMRSGRYNPWPWTVNMEGKGLWFDSEQEALRYALRNHKRGARSFDVGCFQINYKWHGEAFQTIAQMFDPVKNARYAADFLSRLHHETGNWPEAAAAYHSRTPKYANRYKARFIRIRASLDESGRIESDDIRGTGPTDATVIASNGLPLLSGKQGVAALGSLVRLQPDPERRSLFAAGG
ncbi:transglycosylase SLT domain-containing protein [Salinihabitans flavidus]|nr:transglycosylase SLT domain-containing protein [Salinihabitans flavidus]